MQAAGGKHFGEPLPAAPGSLAKLGGSDVVLLFLESYGAAAFDHPRYGPALAPRIAALERSLRGAGFHMASARLESPTFRSEEHTSELQSLMRSSYAAFCLKTKNKAL